MPYDSSSRESPNQMVRGSKKYKEWINKDSSKIDKYSNLPFTFSKPPKRTKHREDIYHVCGHCRHVTMVNKYTAGLVCPDCKRYSSVTEDSKFYNLEDLEDFFNGNE